MTSLYFSTRVLVSLGLAMAMGLGIQRATAASKNVQLPQTITTVQGKTFNHPQFVGAEPDGITIEYKPQAGGIGMTKIKFQNLPESLRQQFNYNEQAAEEFAAARTKMLADWQERTPREPQRQDNVEESQASVGNSYPVGRFYAAGTIRGVIIVDTITGEAWMADLHSTLQAAGAEDYSRFLRPKLLLPATPSNAVVITP
jgi:hypothetical protein